MGNVVTAAPSVSAARAVETYRSNGRRRMYSSCFFRDKFASMAVEPLFLNSTNAFHHR